VLCFNRARLGGEGTSSDRMLLRNIGSVKEKAPGAGEQITAFPPAANRPLLLTLNL